MTKAVIPDTVAEIPQQKNLLSFFQPRFYNPLLVVGLVVASFFLGSLVTKVQYLEKGTTANAPQVAGAQAQPGQQAGPTKENIKTWASEIGLNMNTFNSCFDKEKHKETVVKDTQEGQALGVNGTPSFFVNGHLIVGALPITVFKNVIEFELQGGDWNNPDASVAELVDGNPQNGEIGKEKVAIDNGHLPVLGNKDATVTIVEFSDFECPYCRIFFNDTFAQLKKEYVETGKVAVYYRHFPLPFHPLATPFAIATECANEQGKFWELHDKIFKSQG